MIWVFGNVTIDLIFRVDRLPTPGETLLARGRQVDLGGKGANQAVMARRGGVATALVAMLGNDADAAWARARLAREGIDGRWLMTADVPSDQSIIMVAPDGENAIVSSHVATASLTPALCRPALEQVSARDVVLMQGNLGFETTRTCLAEARRRGARTMLNPAPIDYHFGPIWPSVDIAIVNEVEAVSLGGDPDPIRAAAALRAQGAGAVVVTLGPRGAALLGPSGRLDVPALPVTAVDTAGAGDVFCGTLALLLHERRDLPAALGIAAKAAALSVTRPGTQSSFPTAAEMAEIMR